MGQPTKIISSIPNELLSMPCCIIRYRDAYVMLNAQYMLLMLSCYFLPQAAVVQRL